jgi:hypothetical protein
MWESRESQITISAHDLLQSLGMSARNFPMRVVFLLVCLLVPLVRGISTPADESRPKFNEYPVKTVYRGRPAPPVITKKWRIMRTRIRQGADSDVEFGGHYTLPRWGCGASCNGFVIVDSISGKIYDGLGLDELPLRWLEGHSGDAVERMEFHPDSRLLKINACLNEANCGLYDYVMIEGTGLKLLRKELLPKEFQYNQ